MKITNHKYKLLTLTVLGLVLSFSSCNEDDTQTVVTKFNLVMEDNFDVDGAPNPAIWSYETGRGTNGWGNNELQFYTDRPENVIVQNGYLIITAKQEAFGGANYTSARLKTQNLFDQKYGRFEARIKLPLGQGLWPAFWMLGSNIDQDGWPKCGEIDIMEYLGNSPTKILGTLHGPGFSGAESIGKTYTLRNSRFDDKFHVFGVEWSENHINWYVDDVLYNQITRKQVEDEGGEWVFNNSFFMILNMAVGGDLPGSPNANTSFPQRMLVDYVRVYQ
ncbi:glycoside hydrolase family 16 protein [Flavobacterium azooxidireducens]|uniref:Glycoside hydrolase family 16 protein n=1 Tax=Flavobacterium azooxidireducens TaxID=1871076 RepID=A0ABY4KB72_9FLAO|nr:glycoside hydrolase family 16 protein [Flavobacterium azooxidireducens]UPQ78046.1 glycoside hydrolase family 16 protein [Flavobacterium azooxidireducens]